MKKIIKYCLSFLLVLVLSLFLIACEDKDVKDLKAVFDSLFTNINVLEVTEDLDFDNLVEGVSITYDSKNEDVIDDQGKVIRAIEDKEAYVVVSLKYKDLTYTDVIIFKVLGTGDIDSNYKVSLDYNNEQGEINYNSSLNLDEIKVNTTINFEIKSKEGFVIDLVLVNGLYINEIEAGEKEANLSILVDGNKELLVRFKEDKNHYGENNQDEDKTALLVISEYGKENKWENDKCYNEIKLTDITFSMTTGTYSGRYFVGTEGNKLPDTWRMYQTENTVLKVEASEATIKTIKITFTTKDDGVLLDSNGKQVESEEVLVINSKEASFEVSSFNGTKGKVFISQIEVVYTFGEVTPIDPTIDPNEDDLKELESAIEKFNEYLDGFNYTIKEISKFDGDLSYENYYYITNDYEKVDSKYIDYDDNDEEAEFHDLFYIVYDSDYVASIIVFDEEDDSYYEITDEEEVDSYLYNSYYYLSEYPLELVSDGFKKNNDYYSCNKNINTTAKKFFGDNDSSALGFTIKETFTQFDVYLKDGKVYKIYAKSNYSYDGDIYVCEYILEFFDYGNTLVVLPEVNGNGNGNEENPIDPSDEDEIGDVIADFYEYNSGKNVEFTCLVNGFIGNLVYVEDLGDCVCVSFKDASFIPTGIQIGSTLRIKGTISTNNGFTEVVVSSKDDVKLFDKELSSIEYASIDDLGSINENYINYVLHLEKVKISRNTASTSRDTNVVLMDLEGNTLTLFIKRNSVYATLFNTLFSTFNTNQYLNISNVVVTVYNNKCELLLTNQTVVEAVVGLYLEEDTFTCLEGTNLNDIIDKLEVKEFSVNGLTTLTKNDYNVECCSGELNSEGKYEIVITKGDNSISAYIWVVAKKVEENVNYQILGDVTAETLVNAYSENVKPGLPSTGDVNILVIPIKFTNSSSDYDLSRLEKAFNGSSNDTGWYSLKSYYETVSYGNLRFNANILAPFETGEKYRSSAASNSDLKYIVNALKYYDDTIDYSVYDQNEDGKLDAVYFIYLAPYDSTGYSDLWWAYCTEQNGYTDYSFDGLELDWYMWASFEFFDEAIYAYYDNSGKFVESKSIYVDINCETIIHETGHLLGLDDYYDYDMDNGVKGGLGSFNMMDCNQGDQDPFSKAILGWLSPTVITYSDYEKEVKSFTDNGDAIIISKNGSGSFFDDELYIIVYYTPTGVNELKKDCDCGLPSVSGFAIYHIDSTIVSKEYLDSANYALNSLEIFKYNNGGASRKLIDLILATGSDAIDTEDYYVVNDDDLFKNGSSINSLTWYDGSSLGCTISFSDYSNQTAKVTIDFE